MELVVHVDDVDLAVPLKGAIAATRRWLENEQHADGYWQGLLRSNSSMEAEWLLAMHILDLQSDLKYQSVVNCVLHEQRSDGSWGSFYGAPSGDLNITVECYAALRSAGYPADHPVLTQAARWILTWGGVENTRVFTKIWLALIGEYPWARIPVVPPEIMLLPQGLPFSLSRFACWARTAIVPLTILAARKACRPLPVDQRLDTLFPHGRPRAPRPRQPLLKEPLTAAFDTLDRALHAYGRAPVQPLRELSIRLASAWLVRRQEADGTWAGIQPPWIYAILALHSEGMALDHPVLAKALQAFGPPWAVETEGRTYLQVSVSPVWDTLWSIRALVESGVEPGNSAAIAAATRWILSQQVSGPGDWQSSLPGVPPGGWAFEFANSCYPDIDDTALALTVLAELRSLGAQPAGLDAAIERGTVWMLAMQSSNGGWGAFDRDNTSAHVARIPFLDYGEALDPPTADVTAHVVEALGKLGRTAADPAVAQAIAFLRSEQEPDGSWFGRWGVNYLYGTSAVLTALEAVGLSSQLPWARRAGRWMASNQNGDGGWGESCVSYSDPEHRGRGPSTSSQTSWALLALLTFDGPEFLSPIRRGVQFLLANQGAEGTWREEHFTGTGFPGYGTGNPDRSRAQSEGSRECVLSRGFMMHFDMYRTYFPLLALSRAQVGLGTCSADVP